MGGQIDCWKERKTDRRTVSPKWEGDEAVTRGLKLWFQKKLFLTASSRSIHCIVLWNSIGGTDRLHLHALFLATAHSGQMNVCEVFCGWYSPSDMQTSLFAAVHRNIGDLHDSDAVLCRVCESVLARVLLE